MNPMKTADWIERRVRLRDMRVLLVVVQAGSMGKAAEWLRTSQPAVSRAIGDLEHALGVRLLDRSRRGIEPTLYGRALVKRGTAVFDELRQGVKEIEFLSDPSAGELSVGASIAVASGLVAAAIDRLTRRYPHVIAHVQAADTGAALRALEERKIDLAVIHLIDPQPSEHVGLEVLFEEPHVVLASAANPWARRRRVKLADLVDEPWVLPAPDSQFGAIALEAFRRCGLDLPRRLVTSGLPVRHALVATGRYFTMAPRIVTAFSQSSATLRQLPIDLPMTRRAVAIATLKGRMLAPVTEAFVDDVRIVARALTRRPTGRLARLTPP